VTRDEFEAAIDGAGTAAATGVRSGAVFAIGVSGFGRGVVGRSGATRSARGVSAVNVRVRTSPSRPSDTGWRPPTETVTAPASPARILTSLDALMSCVSPALNVRSAVTRPSAVTRIHAVRRAARPIVKGDRESGIGDRKPLLGSGRLDPDAGAVTAAAFDSTATGLPVVDCGRNSHHVVPINAIPPKVATAAINALAGGLLRIAKSTGCSAAIVVNSKSMVGSLTAREEMSWIGASVAFHRWRIGVGAGGRC